MKSLIRHIAFLGIASLCYGQADLTINYTSSSIISVVPEETILPTILEKNLGTSNVSTHNIGYYLSTDSLLSSDDILVSSSELPALSAQNNQYVNIKITIPKTTTLGDYYLIGLVDYDNKITESNELNNTKALFIHVVKPNVDLRPNKIFNESYSLIAGIEYATTPSEKNIGTTPAFTRYLGHFLSKDTLLSNDDITLGQSLMSTTLPEGKENSIGFNLNIPKKTTGGKYYILSVSDYTHLIQEINEQNNIAYAFVTVIPSQQDFYIYSLEKNTPDNIFQENDITLKLVENYTSNIPVDTHQTGFFISKDSIFSNDDILIDSTSKILLYFTHTFRIPISIEPGSYYFLAVADYLNTTDEINEFNNSKSIPFTLLANNTDLRVESIYSNRTSYSSTGDKINLNVIQVNEGNTLNQNGSIQFFISKDSIWDINDPKLERLNTNVYDSSLSNKSILYRALVSLPSTLSLNFGKYYIIAYCNYNKGVYEINEINNYKTFAITIDPNMVDLKLHLLTASRSSLPAGEGVDVDLIEENIGNKSIVERNMEYFLSEDTIFDTKDQLLTVYRNIIALSPDYSELYHHTVYIPSKAPVGNYYLLAITNRMGVEKNTKNNLAFVPLNVTNCNIELSISSHKTQDTLHINGSLISLSTIIKNSGSTGIRTRIAYFFTKNLSNTLELPQIYSDYFYLGPQSSNSIITKNDYFRIDTGSYSLVITVDHEDQALETVETNNSLVKKITIVEPYTDLIVSNLELSKSIIVAGEEITINSKIKNKGNVPTFSNIQVAYFLSKDSLWSSDDTYFNEINSTPLYPNYVENQTNRITIPKNLNSGNYYIIAKADINNMAREINESNNTKATLLKISPAGVDLRITDLRLAIISPVATKPGNEVRVFISKSNEGVTTALAHRVGFYVTKDTANTNSSNLLFSFDVSSVIGLSVDKDIFNTFVLPTTLTSGEYYLMAVIDDKNVIAEINELNNFKWIKLQISRNLVDLRFDSVSLPNTTLVQTNPFTIYSRWTNLGNVPPSIPHEYYISKDQTFDTLDSRLSLSICSESFNGFSTYSTSCSYYLPKNIIPGDYYILSYLNTTSDVNIIDNIYPPIQVKVIPPDVDLVIKSLELANPCVQANTSLMPKVTVANIGSTISETFKLGYYISTDSVYNSQDLFVGYTNLNSKYPNSEELLEPYVSLIQQVAAGSYYLIMIIDYDNIISETKEANNSKVIQFSVSNSTLVDLSLLSMNASFSTVGIGDAVQANLNIRNLGNTTSKNMFLEFYLSKDTIQDGSDVKLSQENLPNLDAGKFVNFNPIVGISNSLLTGDYYLIAIIKSLTANYDPYLNNNQIKVRIKLESQNIDLTISSISLPTTSISKGYFINPKIVELNSGTTSCAINHTTNYFLSSDLIYDQSDVLLGSTTMRPIGAGDTSAVSAQLMISTQFSNGTYYLLAVADFGRSISESNEENNVKALRIQLAFPILDIKAHMIQAPSAVNQGSTITVVTELQNRSNLAISEHYMALYLSDDSLVYDESSRIAILNYTTSVQSYQTEKASFTITLPKQMIGRKYLIFVTDMTGSGMTDGDKSNNYKNVALEILPTTWDLKFENLSFDNGLVDYGPEFLGTLEYSNNGNQDAKEFGLSHYLSKDSVFDTEDVYLPFKNSTLPNLSITANSKNRISYSLILPSNSFKGTYYIIAKLDGGDKYLETNEYNNIGYTKVNIVDPYKDYAVDRLLVSNIMESKNYITATTTIRRGGINGVGNSFDYLGYYLSKDSIWQNTDLFLDYTNLTNNTTLGKTGGSLSQTIPIPSEIAAGDYYLIAFIDYLNTSVELFENNNTKATPIKLSIVTNISEEKVLKKKADLYPNPSRGTVFIDRNFTEDLDIEVYTIAHQKIKTFKGVRNILQLEDLSSGIYFLMLSAGDHFYMMQKLILDK